MASRERQWDIQLAGKGYIIARDENGVPKWSSQSLPWVSGQQLQIAEEERQLQSWHAGFGYSNYIYPHTYHYATGIDCRWPRQMIMGPLVYTLGTGSSGTVTGFFEQSGALYCLGSRYIHQISTSTDNCLAPNNGVQGKDLGGGNAATSAISFDAKTIVLLGDGVDAYEFDGATWTQATNNNPNGIYAAVFQTASSYALAKSYIDTYPVVNWLLQSNALDSAAWGSGVAVGDGSFAITGLAGKERFLWVAKTDGLYSIDSTLRTPRVMEALPVDANNGKGLFIDSEGWVWYPSKSGLLRYHSINGSVMDATPGRGLPNASGIAGSVPTVCQWRGWYYTWVYNGTSSYLMCGRERESNEPGVGPMIWHGAIASATGQVSAMHITGLTNPPRLYYSIGQAVHYIKLPAHADNPLLDSNYRYAETGSIYLPSDEMGISGIRFAPMGFIIDNEGCGSNTYVSLYMQINGGNFVPIGDAQVDGRAWVPIPDRGDYRYNRAALRLDFTNISSLTTPKVRAVISRAARRMETRPFITTNIVLSESVRKHYGDTSRRTGEELYNELDRLSIQGSIALIDTWTGQERSRQCLVMPINSKLVQERSYPEAPQEAIEVAEVALSILESETVNIEVTVPAYSPYWNDGTVWGQGYKWQ